MTSLRTLNRGGWYEVTLSRGARLKKHCNASRVSGSTGTSASTSTIVVELRYDQVFVLKLLAAGTEIIPRARYSLLAREVTPKAQHPKTYPTNNKTLSSRLEVRVSYVGISHHIHDKNKAVSRRT